MRKKLYDNRPKRIIDAEMANYDFMNKQATLLKQCKSAIIVLRNMLKAVKLEKGLEVSEQLLKDLKHY